MPDLRQENIGADMTPSEIVKALQEYAADYSGKTSGRNAGEAADLIERLQSDITDMKVVIQTLTNERAAKDTEINRWIADCQSLSLTLEERTVQLVAKDAEIDKIVRIDAWKAQRIEDLSAELAALKSQPPSPMEVRRRNGITEMFAPHDHPIYRVSGEKAQTAEAGESVAVDGLGQKIKAALESWHHPHMSPQNPEREFGLEDILTPAGDGTILRGTEALHDLVEHILTELVGYERKEAVYSLAVNKPEPPREGMRSDHAWLVPVYDAVKSNPDDCESALLAVIKEMRDEAFAAGQAGAGQINAAFQESIMALADNANIMKQIEMGMTQPDMTIMDSKKLTRERVRAETVFAKYAHLISDESRTLKVFADGRE